MTDTYETTEGFELHRPLLMPDATSFADVLTAERVWDFATMNHRNGEPQAGTPEEIELRGLERRVSRFCSVRNMPGRYHMQVTPTPALMELLKGDTFAFFDRIEFQAIYHENRDRVLIIADASQIIASRYLAYVPLGTVPTPESLDAES